MTDYTIKIDGIPDGYEPDTATYVAGVLDHCVTITLRRKVRKYDWSKTLDDVLLTSHAGFIHKCARTHYPHKIATIWQPNIHGKCPVDGEASIVRVRQCDGEDYEDLASNFNWDVDIVYRWQFIRLADGVEW